VFMLVIQNQTHSALADLRGKLVRHFAHDGSTFSGVGASGKPGTVQLSEMRPWCSSILAERRRL
jgi:hypothetical protein